MVKIKFDTQPDLFEVHAEFNQITGMIFSVLENNAVNRKITIDKAFPNFVKMVDEINSKMEKYSIT